MRCEVGGGMAKISPSVLLAMLMLTIPLSGCLEGSISENDVLDEANVVFVDPCTSPSEILTQVFIDITVNGDERQFRLSAPSSDAGTLLPVIIAFHGGGGSAEDFQQQNQFDQLGQDEKFIMAYAIAEEDRTAAEGEWYLNTAATSREDNIYVEHIIENLSKSHCIDEDRLYGIGYSLGSMFTYEIACQMNHQFAAVASFAGTMPVTPETCDLDGSMAVMHIHGKLDYIIDYDDDWDWKEGEHEGVGTMSNIPGMIDYWAEISNCENGNTHAHLFEGDEVEHIVHSDCDGDVRIEHYGMEAQEHAWPNQVDGTNTYELMWNFLSEFTN